MDILQQLAQELNIKPHQAEAAVRLIDEGNTIPFIARYRKEATGSLDDEVLRALDERLRYLRNLEEKKQQVLATIEEQGKLTDEIRRAVEEASTLVAVEDIYRPYRPKRRTRGSIAREKGLAPLAELIMAQETKVPLEETALQYLSEKEGLEVRTPEEAIAGALDILAEDLSDRAEIRSAIRKACSDHGSIGSSLKNEEARELDAKRVYEAYYDYHEEVRKMPGHRVLALNRGEKEGILTVRLEAPEEQIIYALERQVIRGNNPVTAPVLKNMIRDSYKRLIAPAVEREIRSQLTEKAEDGAIAVFGKNLTQLLMQPPIEGQVVLGWDPAFRTGCKLAVADPTGKILYTTVIYPTAPQNRVAESKKILKEIIQKYGVTLISLGNGTASRESEQVITELIREMRDAGMVAPKYVIVNEAGASVYSASALAAEEFPQFDVGQRSSASMARRLQDPLAELVKIDPRSIGVGQYQHDMDQKKLAEALHNVVEDAVNRVGVDLNTASAALLGYVSGIGKTLAQNIVAYREENGRFRNRRELLKVSKLGPKAFEQCAGFLRIRGGSEPLDATAVHPESYEAARKLLEILGQETLTGNPGQETLTGNTTKSARRSKDSTPGVPDTFLSNEYFRRAADKKGMKEKAFTRWLASELGIGEPTLADILRELEKPGRDPRKEMPLPILRSDVLEMKDLKEGMVLRGTVRNVIDFGAFVDIGVHQDGLVHLSQMTDRYIKHPLEVVSVGDIVNVKVLGVDLKKQRISLTMKI